MTGFLYYLPNRGSDVKLDDVRAAGIGYAFDQQINPRGCMRGPDGHSGVVVSADEHGLGYYPERQEWRQLHGSDLWVGMYRDDRPTAETLARPDLLDGIWLTLDDGGRWLAPKARRWEEFDGEIYPIRALPSRLTLDSTGRWMLGDVKSRYRQLWSWVLAYEEAFTEAVRNEIGGMVRFGFDPINEMAVAALQVNYRVAAIELDMLGVFDIEARDQIIDALLDNATWRAWAKKKYSGPAVSGGGFSSGREASTAEDAIGTSQQSPSCGPSPLGSTATTN